MKPVSDPKLLAQLNGPVTDPNLLAQLNGTPSDARVLQDVEDQKIRDELKASGGILENIGAGMNRTVQGVKQLFGKGESDEAITERRRIDEQLAEGQTGGGLIQLGGELAMSAPITGGVAGLAGKALTKAPVVGRLVQALASKGGRVANVGTMARGAAEGALGGLVTETTSDESPTFNTAAGATMGAAAPAVFAAGGKLVRTLGKKNASNRAAEVFEKQMGPDDMHDVNFRLATEPAPGLPLTTAARTQNPKLASLERGARGREDFGYRQDRKVAEAAWDKVKGVTSAADELPTRVADREFLMKESKDFLNEFDNPTLVRRAANDVSDVAEEIRATPVGRQNPDVTKMAGEVEILLKHPDSTAADFSSQYWRLSSELEKPGLTTEAKDALLKLRDAVGKGADTASGGTHFTDLLERYKVEQGMVDESQAAKGIRESFVDETGVPQTKRHWFGTPEVESSKLRQTMSKLGKNKYGNVLDDQARTKLSELEGELGRHEMYKAGNSPGSAQLDIGNPLSVVSTGRDNPFNFLPLVKGGANWLFSGSRKATTEAADEAMMSPDAWKRMMEQYAKSKSPLSHQEYAARMRRQLLLTPGRVGTAELGD